MAIYTRTGDKGNTSLFDGTRVLKSHIRVDAYGTVDELNSLFGVVISLMQVHTSHLPQDKQENWEDIVKTLIRIQHTLFDIGSSLAVPAAMPVHDLEKDVKEFEQLIDELTAVMPELKNFILPGGSQVASLLHYGRTVTRRAERGLVALAQEEAVDAETIMYFNRLSDLLFTLARFINHSENKKEIVWIKR